MSSNTDFRKSQMTFSTAGGSEPVQLGAFGEEHCLFFNICMLGLKYIENSVYMGRCSVTDRRRTSDFQTCYFSTGRVGNFYINVNMGFIHLSLRSVLRASSLPDALAGTRAVNTTNVALTLSELSLQVIILKYEQC